MRIPQSDEYIGIINDLLKTQNRRIKKYFTVADEAKAESRVKLVEVANKFEALKRYVSETLLPEVEINTQTYNLRYIFNYIEDTTPDTKLQYFKILIKNKISNQTNFIIVSYNFREVTVKVKPVNSAEDLDLESQVFAMEKLTHGKIRKIFFEYFQEIILADTMPRYKAKRGEIGDSAESAAITAINIELERMRIIAERNRQMLLEANAKKMALKQQMEAEKDKILNNEQ